MSNKKRRCEPGLTYHITSRCIEKEPKMASAEMKDLLLLVIKLAQDKYSFELNCHTIMNNHFHLMITTITGGETISQIMQLIKSQYARRYNKKMKRNGPFWNERFRDNIIEDSICPIYTFNYINQYIINNPVRAGIVTDARDYQYGCIHHYINENYQSMVKLTFSKYSSFHFFGKNI